MIVLTHTASGKVSNLTLLGVNDTTLRISWAEPQQPNGKILHYNISMVDLGTHKTINFQNVIMSLIIDVGNLGKSKCSCLSSRN